MKIGLVGFEPTACRRGDRSIIPDRARLYLVRSCGIAHVALLPNEWQNFHYGLAPRAIHASLPWTRQHCGGEYDQSNPRKNLRSVVRFSGCAGHNNKTCLNQHLSTSGWWDLNPRPPGPEPGAIPSFATARTGIVTLGYATDAPLTSRIFVQMQGDRIGVRTPAVEMIGILRT
jgi:hypothetical protein